MDLLKRDAQRPDKTIDPWLGTLCHIDAGACRRSANRRGVG
jgi:hypothetical protein